MPFIETSHQFSQEVMDFLSLWHRRMAHCPLEAVVAMADGAARGMDPAPPANMPSMAELGPYRERLGCSACLSVYGSASGPNPDQA